MFRREFVDGDGEARFQGTAFPMKGKRRVEDLTREVADPVPGLGLHRHAQAVGDVVIDVLRHQQRPVPDLASDEILFVLGYRVEEMVGRRDPDDAVPHRQGEGKIGGTKIRPRWESVFDAPKRLLKVDVGAFIDRSHG